MPRLPALLFIVLVSTAIIGCGGLYFKNSNALPAFANPTPTPHGYWSPERMQLESQRNFPVKAVSDKRLDLSAPQASPDGKFVAASIHYSKGNYASSRLVIWNLEDGIQIVRTDDSVDQFFWRSPREIMVDGALQVLCQVGNQWQLKRTGSPFDVMQKPRELTGGQSTAERAAQLFPHADLALWSMPNDGRPEKMSASSLSSSRVIGLPSELEDIDPQPGPNTFAAASYKGKGAQLLAAWWNPKFGVEKSVLAVWDLKTSKKLWSRSYSTSTTGNLIWFADSLMASSIPQHQTGTSGGTPDFSDERIELIVGQTGKTYASVTVANLKAGSATISEDGKFLLTTSNTFSQSKRKGSITIHAVPSMKPVAKMERSKEILASPLFTPHNPHLLLWASGDTLFVQKWVPSRRPLPLAPRRLKYRP